MSDLFNGVAPTASGSSGGATNMGIDFTAQHTGTVAGISFWAPPVAVPASVIGTLYDTQTQAVVASAVAGALTPNAWNLIPFAVPQAITPGRLYTASTWSSAGNVGFTGGLLVNHVFNGDLTGMLRTGRFTNGAAPAFPGSPAADAFGVDLSFSQTPTCPECPPCPPCPPTTGFLINLTSPGFINVVTGVGNCVIGALEQTPAGAPCRQCLLLPTSIIPWDNCGPCDPACSDCCVGQVALAILDVYGSDQFPRPLNGASWRKCNHRYEIVHARVSVTRCVPTMGQTGEPPTCAEELAAAVTLENDRTATRQAIACCLTSANVSRPDLVSEWVIGPSQTVGESGGCAGVETEFWVGTQSCLCPN